MDRKEELRKTLQHMMIEEQTLNAHPPPMNKFVGLELKDSGNNNPCSVGKSKEQLTNVEDAF
jgi:hypothetical protein